MHAITLIFPFYNHITLQVCCMLQNVCTASNVCKLDIIAQLCSPQTICCGTAYVPREFLKTSTPASAKAKIPRKRCMRLMTYKLFKEERSQSGHRITRMPSRCMALSHVQDQEGSQRAVQLLVGVNKSVKRISRRTGVHLTLFVNISFLWMFNVLFRVLKNRLPFS